MLVAVRHGERRPGRGAAVPEGGFLIVGEVALGPEVHPLPVWRRARMPVVKPGVPRKELPVDQGAWTPRCAFRVLAPLSGREALGVWGARLERDRQLIAERETLRLSAGDADLTTACASGDGDVTEEEEPIAARRGIVGRPASGLRSTLPAGTCQSADTCGS